MSESKPESAGDYLKYLFRWILVLPITLLALLISTWVAMAFWNTGWHTTAHSWAITKILMHVVVNFLGSMFGLICGAKIAPSHQHRVAAILFILILTGSIVLIPSAFNDSRWYGILDLLMMNVGSFAACTALFEEHNVKIQNRNPNL